MLWSACYLLICLLYVSECKYNIMNINITNICHIILILFVYEHKNKYKHILYMLIISHL